MYCRLVSDKSSPQPSSNSLSQRLACLDAIFTHVIQGLILFTRMPATCQRQSSEPALREIFLARRTPSILYEIFAQNVRDSRYSFSDMSWPEKGKKVPSRSLMTGWPSSNSTTAA